jgi:hypothetical protein
MDRLPGPPAQLPLALHLPPLPTLQQLALNHPHRLPHRLRSPLVRRMPWVLETFQGRFGSLWGLWDGFCERSEKGCKSKQSPFVSEESQAEVRDKDIVAHHAVGTFVIIEDLVHIIPLLLAGYRTVPSYSLIYTRVSHPKKQLLAITGSAARLLHP